MRSFRLVVFLLAMICLYTIDVSAQSGKRTDSVRVFSLLALAEEHFSKSDYDSARWYAEKAEAWSIASKYRPGQIWSLIKKSEIYIDQDELVKASNQLPELISLCKQTKDSLALAVTWMLQAQVHLYSDRLQEAATWFEKCIGVYFQKHPSFYAALAYNDYGYTLGAMGELRKKADNLLISLRIYEKVTPDDYGELAVTLNNLSTVYYEMKDMEKAIEYSKQSLVYREKAGDFGKLSLGCCNISQIYRGINAEEAIRYQQLCVKYAEKSKDDNRMVHAYITSSLIAVDQKDRTKAMDFELKAIALLEKSKRNPVQLARRYISVGILLLEMGEDSSRILSNYSKAAGLLAVNNDKYSLRDLHEQLAICYKKFGDYRKAYEHYTKHILYRDSLISSGTEASIAELEKKYQTEKKDNEISRLNTEQRIRQLQIEKQNAVIAGNLLEAKRKEDEIELLSKAQELQGLRIRQQDEQLERQQLQARNREQQLQLVEKESQLQDRLLQNSRTTRNFLVAGTVLLLVLGGILFNRYQLKRRIREQQNLLAMRNHIAKDLHDEIGSALTSIKILSEVSGRKLEAGQDKAADFIRQITEQSTAAQQGMSDIVWAVKPENDKLRQLLIRMREYVAQTLELINIRTDIFIDESLLERTLEMNQRKDFLLIFREAVNNIAKYASATEVGIRLMKKEGGLLFQITDNGKGFDTGKVTSSSGLKNMVSRATALNGTLDIESAPGAGTRIGLFIPTT